MTRDAVNGARPCRRTRPRGAAESDRERPSLPVCTGTCAAVPPGGANSSSAGNGGNDDDEEAVGAESWWYFHLMMAAVALYIAMLLTEFSSVPAEVNGVPLSRNDIEKWEANPPERKAASMIATFWVKVGSQWACLLMYAWTLLAPYLLRESRDFGIEFDD